jgi:hypothetical protein
MFGEGGKNERKELTQKRSLVFAIKNSVLFRYWDAMGQLCPKGACSTYNGEKFSLYMDDSHLSYRGARIMARDIIAGYGNIPFVFQNAFPKGA